jgi:hypothetical protein
MCRSRSLLPPKQHLTDLRHLRAGSLLDPKAAPIGQDRFLILVMHLSGRIALGALPMPLSTFDDRTGLSIRLEPSARNRDLTLLA